MKPVCEAIEQSVNTAEKITEYKYLFTDDKVVKTSGSASSGDVYEWTITSAPQYFYIDNIDFDAVESIYNKIRLSIKFSRNICICL